MASKKERQKHRRYHQDNAQGGGYPLITAENADDWLDFYRKKLQNCLFLFPEVTMETPLRLGAFYEATVQIGNDQPQERRVIAVVMSTNIGVDVMRETEELRRFCKTAIKNSVVKISSKSDLIIKPELQVLYPVMISGWEMTAIKFFGWYGNEPLKVTEVKKYVPPSKKFLCMIQPFQTKSVVMAGKFIGRQLDGVEILERENMTVGD